MFYILEARTKTKSLAQPGFELFDTQVIFSKEFF